MDFKRTFGHWGDQTIKTRNEASLAYLILEANSFAEMKPEVTALNALGPKDEKLRVLDFGCGVGRHLNAMPKNWSVTGYDSAEMLARVPEYLAACGGRAVSEFDLTSDWEAVRAKEFDAVLASLVFQHVSPPVLEEYLRDLQMMTPLLVIWGRCWNDANDRKAYFPLVLEYFNVPEDIKYKSLNDSVLVIATSKVKEAAKPVVVSKQK